MDQFEIVRRRLVGQRLVGPPFTTPAETVRSLLAVQAQEFGYALWSIGMRTAGSTQASVAAAFDRGAMIRTHLLRPTWHFVAPDDLHWLLDLTAPRVQMQNAGPYRQLDLDRSTLARSAAVIAAALRDGNHLNRNELVEPLTRAGIAADSRRLNYIVMNAELEGVICNGPVRGKQQTYALIEEWAPRSRSLDRDEALAELTRRFFAGHGPATVRDCATWAGLTLTDVRRGIEAAGAELLSAEVDGQSLWFSASSSTGGQVALDAFLLPQYDEAFLTFKSLNFPMLERVRGDVPWGDDFVRPIVIGLYRVGVWKRSETARRVLLEANIFAALNRDQSRALDAAADRYGTFMERPVELRFA